MNKNKIILDLCGGSGEWSRNYKENGYDVRNITLPDYNVNSYLPPIGVYGILAAPPCTMFSLARTTANIPRNLKSGMVEVIACLHIIWLCRYEKKLSFWCLENPMGILRQFLGKPVFTFQPFEFGDRYKKKTDLWGYFNNPIKNAIDLNQLELNDCYENKRMLPSISDLISGQKADRRAITPPGFARAFFEANR